MTANQYYFPPGQCRFCKCTEDNACNLSTGDTCSWASSQRNCCTNPECLKAAHAERERADHLNRKANRKKSTAEVHELIRRGNRRRRPEGAPKKAGAA